MAGTKTKVIAEIGENHCGDWQLAEKMIVEAARAGADFVKFQSYLASEVADTDPEKEWFQKVQVSDAMHFTLKAAVEKCGAQFLSSCFSLNRAKFLVETLGLRTMKVASSEMLNFGLLNYLNGRVETLFLSTGLATLEEIKTAVSHLDQIPDLVIMQCTTSYPCPDSDANLNVIRTLKQTFPKHSIGYSDHTLGTRAAVIAVALGAQVIEKHFTLDKTLPGTDHILSADPQELKTLVEELRAVETLLGDSDKHPTSGESEIKSFVRSRFPKT